MYKKAMGLAMMGLLLIGTTTANAYTSRLTPFQDLANDAWSAENIYMLSSVNAIQGYEDGTFHPLDAMSREAFIQLLVSAASAQPDSSRAVEIRDVQPDRWSYGAIQAALQQHWIDFLLDSQGNLHPAEPIRREEVAAAVGYLLMDKLNEAEKKQWITADWLAERNKQTFSDGAGIDNALLPFVYYTIHSGVMQGNEQGFSPDSPLSRQEAAKVIKLTLDYEISGRPLEVTGFYAIQSYASINRMPLLDNVALGWSHLDYTSAGTAGVSMTTDSSKFSIPTGWEEVTKAADQASVAKELVVFANESHRIVDFIGDASARKAFVDSLMRLVDDPKYGFQGVCLDFEDLYQEKSRDGFNALVREVKDRLKDKKLTVALPPLFYYQGYDAKFIGETADTIILMAYNFLHKESRLPSAPLPLVSEAIQQMLDAGVSKDKLVLGIGKQSNQWISRSGEETTYESPSSELVEERLKKAGVLQSLAVPYLLSHLAYDDNGSHELYYEDADSIERKIWLARYYGLKGISLWYMGQFVDRDWEPIAQLGR